MTRLELRYRGAISIRDWAAPFAAKSHLRELDQIIENRLRAWQAERIGDAIGRKESKPGQLSFADIKRAHEKAVDDGTT